ncbi:unnamed protein product [Arctogadus glacialis]
MCSWLQAVWESGQEIGSAARWELVQSAQLLSDVRLQGNGTTVDTKTPVEVHPDTRGTRRGTLRPDTKKGDTSFALDLIQGRQRSPLGFLSDIVFDAVPPSVCWCWTGAEIRSSWEAGGVCGFTVVYLSIRPHYTDGVWGVGGGVGGGRGEGLTRRSVEPSGSVSDERERLSVKSVPGGQRSGVKDPHPHVPGRQTFISSVSGPDRAGVPGPPPDPGIAVSGGRSLMRDARQRTQRRGAATFV